MALILPGRRTRQPSQAARINWNNPITRGLAAVFDMTGPAPVDLLSRYSGSPANYSKLSTTAGIGFKKNKANVDGQRSILGSNPSSAIVISSPPSVATIKPFFSQRPAAGGGQYTFAANMDVGFAASAGTLTLSTNGVVQMTAAAAITGNTAMYGYSLTSSSTGQLYVNGAPVTTSTTNTGYPTITGPDFNIMSHTSTAAFNDSATPLLVLWNRALTDAEHRSLALNPWQIFVPLMCQLYVGAPAAGSVSVAVSTSQGQSLTAALSTGVDGASTTSQGQSVTAAASTAVTGVSTTSQGQSITAATSISVATSATTSQGQSASAAAALVQLVRPASDITTGGWLPSTGTDLYAVIDETPYSDTDYINTTTPSVSEVKFGSGSDPFASTGHVVRYRAKATGLALQVDLVQGTTIIATHTPTLTTSYQDFSFTLSAPQADAITNYSDLRLRFTST